MNGVYLALEIPTYPEFIIFFIFQLIISFYFIFLLFPDFHLMT